MELNINNLNKSIMSPQFRASQNLTSETKSEEKQRMSSTAKLMIGLGLTALGTYAIYALTKKKPELKNDQTIDLKNNETVLSIEEMITKFKQTEAGKKYKDIEPKIIKLDNGRTKIKFNYKNSGIQESTMLIIDKNGLPEKKVIVDKMPTKRKDTATFVNKISSDDLSGELLRYTNDCGTIQTLQKRFPDGKLYEKLYKDGKWTDWTCIS